MSYYQNLSCGSLDSTTQDGLDVSKNQNKKSLSVNLNWMGKLKFIYLLFLRKNWVSEMTPMV